MFGLDLDLAYEDGRTSLVLDVRSARSFSADRDKDDTGEGAMARYGCGIGPSWVGAGEVEAACTCDFGFFLGLREAVRSKRLD